MNDQFWVWKQINNGIFKLNVKNVGNIIA